MKKEDLLLTLEERVDASINRKDPETLQESIAKAQLDKCLRLLNKAGFIKTEAIEE